MTAAIINLLLPISFPAAIVFFIYGIVLFFMSIAKKSRRLRIKSLKMGIPGIVYAVGLLTLFAVLKRNYNQKKLPEITGQYVYFRPESTCMKLIFSSDNKFWFENGQQPIVGSWDIETNTNTITLYDLQKKVLTRTDWLKTPSMRAVLFEDQGTRVELTKY